MNNFLKRLIFILTIITIVVLGYSYFNDGLLSNSLSPKKTISFRIDDIKLELFYNRPSKRDRKVFGALVPYNKVWRTGANEATTFKTNTPLKIGNKTLSKGKYTLWTVPNDTAWRVIFNSKMYPWGVDETMAPMRDPKFDVIQYIAPVERLTNTVEQFTMAIDNSIDNLSLTMAWENTKIVVPLK